VFQQAALSGHRIHQQMEGEGIKQHAPPAPDFPFAPFCLSSLLRVRFFGAFGVFGGSNVFIFTAEDAMPRSRQ
jgi:hypothetical protein